MQHQKVSVSSKKSPALYAANRIRTSNFEKANNAIESQTMKVPNLVFMGLAGVSIAGAVIAALKKKDETDLANFIGHWAPTILLFGLYNKIVKLESKLFDSN